jgi:hypothetical protein
VRELRPYPPGVVDDPGASSFNPGEGIFCADHLERARLPREVPQDTDIGVRHYKLSYRWPGHSGAHPGLGQVAEQVQPDDIRSRVLSPAPTAFAPVDRGDDPTPSSPMVALAVANAGDLMGLGSRDRGVLWLSRVRGLSDYLQSSLCIHRFITSQAPGVVKEHLAVSQ